ncbi:MAG: hypothetical protein ACPGXL_04100, partial [Chitinophagales bacterium]
MTNFLQRLSKQTAVFALLIVGLFTFNACEDDGGTSTNNCDITISSFKVNPSTIDKLDGTTSIEVKVDDKIGLDEIAYQSLIRFYLSSDEVFDSGSDTEVAAFLNGGANAISVSGTQVTIEYNQVEIPVSTTEGDYFLIAVV